MMKLIRKVQVKNSLGLHTRPATVIVQLLQQSASRVSFTYRRETINARSLLSILMLAASKDARLTITVEGEDADAQQTMSRLVDAFENSFGENGNYGYQC